MTTEPPIQQPGGDVLSEMQRVLLRWTRGEIYSDEAFNDLGDVIVSCGLFDSIIESAGWNKRS